LQKGSQLFICTHNVCGGSQIVAELKEFPVRRTKTSPLPIRQLNAIRRSYICDWVFTVEEVIADLPKPGF
jgi:hypothetical protein